MTEPLNVRVEKIKGSVRTPIPLPPGEDGATQGENWSKSDVKNLEQWLVNEWSGGGSYAISVTDSSEPTPNKHEWQIFYPPSAHPEKVPPSLTAGANPADFTPIATPSPTPQPQQVRNNMGTYPSAFPNGLPAGYVLPQQAQPQPQQVFYTQAAPALTPPAAPAARQDFYANQAQLQAQAAAEIERRRMEDKVRDMEAQLTKAREDQLQAQHRQEMVAAEARMRAEQGALKDQFEGLKATIAALATSLTSAATAKPTVDPVIEALKEQNRALAAERDNDKREREAERREREMKDLILSQKEDTRRQIEAIQAAQAAQAAQHMAAAQAQAAQHAAALAAASANKGPDPMLMFMQENSRLQVEASKEQARNIGDQMKTMQSFMMNPRDIMAMSREASNGLDKTTNELTRAYGDIFNMQRQAVETVMQLNSGGGTDIPGMIDKGLERASGMFEKYVGGKAKESIAAQQSQAQIAQAQAQAMAAQAQAMAVQAHREDQARIHGAGGGLNGTTVNTVAAASPNGIKIADAIPVVTSAKPEVKDTWTTGPVPPASAFTPAAPIRLGRTDEQWFGELMPRVTELREGVARFFESIKMSPIRLNEKGLIDGIEPEQAATAILRAATFVMHEKMPILAMMDLLGQGRVADFMDILLPEAEQPYRDEVAQIVLKELTGGDDDEDEDEDEDDDEDGEDGEDEPVVIKAAPRVGNGHARA